MLLPVCVFFFFFNDTATTEIYTLSLHDALPIFMPRSGFGRSANGHLSVTSGLSRVKRSASSFWSKRSEEHTSELQSPCNLVCRLLLEKKKTIPRRPTTIRIVNASSSASHERFA